MKTDLCFHATGRWTEAQVHTAWSVTSTRAIVPEVEAIIDRTWARASAQLGQHLFDGPMCRMDAWHAAPDALRLSLSPTSYKPFLGTNLHNPDVADRFGREVLANPVGVSPALLTADNWLMMGRRNANVAYYPERIHPFAGAQEPRDGANVFDAVRRELAEEVLLSSGDIEEIICTGIAEDVALRQPELIFATRVTRTRHEIEAKLDRTEHHAAWSIPAEKDAIEQAVDQEHALTPVARAALLLWGRMTFGDDWFTRARQLPER